VVHIVTTRVVLTRFTDIAVRRIHKGDASVTEHCAQKLYRTERNVNFHVGVLVPLLVTVFTDLSKQWCRLLSL